MFKEIFLVFCVMFYIYGIGLKPTVGKSSDKTREKRGVSQSVSQLSEKTFKKEQASVSAFGKFGNRLFTKTWPKLVSGIY